MTRAFRPDPVDISRILEAGRRAPAAGNTREGRRFVVVDTPTDYWAVTLPDPSGFAFPGLLRAPVLVVVCCSPDAYAARYAEPDKASRLGHGPAAWPQPFWWFDAGTAAEAMLLQARQEGLGACLFGLFQHEVAVLDRFGVGPPWRGACTIALGLAEDEQPRGRSADRHRTEGSASRQA